MKEAKDLTIEDISQLKKEISHFYHLRALFAGLGWTVIVVGIVLFLTGLISGNGSGAYPYMYFIYAAFCCIPIAIVFFVLRSALFNSRINSRKSLIKEAEYYIDLKAKEKIIKEEK